jgi:protocatechuate 3,4-dioxygenase beta subunit
MKKVVVIALAVIAANAAIAGTITGVVTEDSTGLPIPDMWVYVLNYDTGEYGGGGGSTNSDGFYSIPDLAEGTCRVRVSTGDSDYAEEYYNNTFDYENAAAVDVPASGVVSDINFGLAIGGTIRGTVVDPNGQPVANMQINIFDYQTDRWRGSSQSNADGEYEIRKIPAGTYRIENDPWQSNYARQFYNGQDDWEKATPVVVNAGGVVEGINFQLALGGSISGMVTDPNGQPVANIQISVVKYPNGNYGFGEMTDPNGIYEIKGLPAGLYRVMVWAEGTIYASEFYDNKIVWDQATPVSVSAGQETTGIDFSLDPGASISGVVKNSSGDGQANVQVNCWVDGGYGTGTWTDANGYYECGGLPVGYTYTVVAYPPADSNYISTRITVGVYGPGEYTGRDIIFGEGGLTISGTITDKATTLPLADVRVGCWNDDFGIWSETRTDPNGIYRLTNLPGGEVDVHVEPESYYAYMGVDELELEENITNLDFALPKGAILCGKVLDVDTAEPLADVEVEYSSEENSVDRSQITEVDGTFCLTQLPPGIAELKARPEVASGYAWNLPWGSDFVCLSEGENRSGRIVALEKGALVSGYIKDADGNPLGGFEYCYTGRDCDGWSETDINGFYQIRLPVGTYYITVDDNEEFGALPAMVTVTDVNGEINVPDITVYTEEDGGQISGEVSNPGAYAKTGSFAIIAFKAGTSFNDPDAWYLIQPTVMTGMEEAEPFSLNTLPPGVNYDIYLCVDNQGPDRESLAVRDSVFNVPVGTTGITLEYNSQGSMVQGIVKNTDDKPVLGATVLLLDSSGFGGFCQTGCNGEYVIYNVPAGIYTATAIHSRYSFASATVEVVEGMTADVNTIVMPFAGAKEGPDLNGDGKVEMADLAEFAGQWLNLGASEADFNQDNEVNLCDWTRIAENWLSKAIWYHE